MENTDKIISILRFILRQADGGQIPKEVPMTNELSSITTREEAQKIYKSVLIELGIKDTDLI